jgi:hypothetical protein
VTFFYEPNPSCGLHIIAFSMSASQDEQKKYLTQNLERRRHEYAPGIFA